MADTTIRRLAVTRWAVANVARFYEVADMYANNGETATAVAGNESVAGEHHTLLGFLEQLRAPGAMEQLEEDLLQMGEADVETFVKQLNENVRPVVNELGIASSSVDTVHSFEGQIRREVANDLNERYRAVVEEYFHEMEQAQENIDNMQTAYERARERLNEEARIRWEWFLLGPVAGISVNAYQSRERNRQEAELGNVHTAQLAERHQEFREIYLDLLDNIQDWIRKHPKYEPGAGGNFNRDWRALELENPFTWCNQAAFDYVALTSPGLMDAITAGANRYDTSANSTVYNLMFRDVPVPTRPELDQALIESLATDEAFSHETLDQVRPHTMVNTTIHEVNERRAQELANEGYTVIGIQYNPNGSGHVAVVRRDANEFNENQGALFSNVGGENEIRYRVRSFESAPQVVRYFYDSRQQRFHLSGDDYPIHEEGGQDVSRFWGY